MNINEMIEAEIQNGYGDTNAQAKVCQDIVLKAISKSMLNRNVTIKGGVVMRSKSGNVRRATQDLDIDFIRYSLSDESINAFVEKLNCIDGVSIVRAGSIEELKQQDYKGKRIYLLITDLYGNRIRSKLDLGVHTHLDIAQEEYCFDIAFDDEGASLLINSNEQMFTEKLRSLLRFGSVSTRYKDIFDMYFLCQHIDRESLENCLNIYIFDDQKMREKDMPGIIRRVEMAFRDNSYLRRLETTNKKWIDDDIEAVLDGIVSFLKSLEE